MKSCTSCAWVVLGYASAALICCLSSSAQAAGAESATAGANVLPKVVVTAEKREADAQTTAIAISAIGADQIANLAATNIGDLATVVPSMQFSAQSAEAVRVQLTIRGIGSDVIEAGADAGVGLYLDGVYMGRTSATLGNIHDNRFD